MTPEERAAWEACAVDGCDREAHTRGWCRRHYLRWLRHGDPTHSADTRRTHCPQGHPYVAGNCYIAPDGYQVCRACRAETKRRYRQRHRRPHWSEVVEARGGVVEVPLSRSAGQVALIDESDLPIVAPYNWGLARGGYAKAESSTGEKRQIHWMHRLILPVPEGLTVDHANRDGLDNRRANLRPANSRQQAGNQRLLRSSNRSGYRGVSWSKRNRVWVAHITDHGRSTYLGQFDDPAAAARAYDSAAIDVFGEFASLNFPGAGEC